MRTLTQDWIATTICPIWGLESPVKGIAYFFVLAMAGLQNCYLKNGMNNLDGIRLGGINPNTVLIADVN